MREWGDKGNKGKYMKTEESLRKNGERCGVRECEKREANKEGRSLAQRRTLWYGTARYTVLIMIQFTRNYRV